MEKVYLMAWKHEGDRVRLIYLDGSELFVRYTVPVPFFLHTVSPLRI